MVYIFIDISLNWLLCTLLAKEGIENYISVILYFIFLFIRHFYRAIYKYRFSLSKCLIPCKVPLLICKMFK